MANKSIEEYLPSLNPDVICYGREPDDFQHCPDSGTFLIAVSANITGLLSNTLYHFELKS
jgi:hypothetical protein